MEVDLKKLKAYFELLLSLGDGQQITVDGVLIKREGNRIWESVFILNEEDEIDDDYIEEASP